MKTNFLLLLSCILLSFSFISCDKDDEPQKTDTDDKKGDTKIEYYVKYEINYTDDEKVCPSTIAIDVITDKVSHTLAINPKWEAVYGPFTALQKVGFEVRTSRIAKMSPQARINGRISICKGNHPYSLKMDNIKTYNNIKSENFSMYYIVLPSDLK